MAKLRPMAAADRPAIVSMLCDLTASEVAVSPDRTADRPPHVQYFADIEAQIAATDGLVLVAERDDGEPIGFVACYVAEDDPYIVDPFRRFVYVSDLFVAPHERRRGHARRLLDAIRAWAAERGHRRLKIGALDGNGAADELYRSLGFRPYVTKYALTLPAGEEPA